jgi:hypothetical protein
MALKKSMKTIAIAAEQIVIIALTLVKKNENGT